MSESKPSELFSLGSLAWGQYWGPMGRNFEISLKIGRNAIQMHVWPVVKLTGCLLINQSINELIITVFWFSCRQHWGEISCYDSCESCDPMSSCDFSSCYDDRVFIDTLIQKVILPILLKYIDSDDDASVEFNEAKYVPPSLSPSQTFLEWNCFLLFNSGFLRNPNFRSVWKFFMRNPWEKTVYQN